MTSFARVVFLSKHILYPEKKSAILIFVMEKSSAKKSRVSAKTSVEKIVTEPITAASIKKHSFWKSKRKYIITIAIIVIIFALLYNFRSYFVVATVNGQPISRASFSQEEDKQAGKQVLSSLIQRSLIFQEADKKHITVSQSDIDVQLKKISDNLAKRGQNLDQALQLSGLSRADLQEQIKTQKILEKLFAKDITVSNKEIDDYITTYNSNQQNAGTQGQPAPQISRADAQQAIQQNKLSGKFKTWLADAQKNAKIVYFITLP